jgi:hypothetical protein
MVAPIVAIIGGLVLLFWPARSPWRSSGLTLIAREVSRHRHRPARDGRAAMLGSGVLICARRRHRRLAGPTLALLTTLFGAAAILAGVAASRWRADAQGVGGASAPRRVGVPPCLRLRPAPG